MIVIRLLFLVVSLGLINAFVLSWGIVDTPNVTNSWCHSRRKVILEDRTVNVRSLWEEKFLLMNPTFSYEITRIPYVDSFGKSRVYIVDFTDSDGNLYEIKPSSKVGESSEKILAARTFCEKNNLKFHLITEKYFENGNV